MHAIWFKGSEPILAILVAPSGLIRVGISQGKPWAMLYWPLRATDWKRPNYRPLRSVLPYSFRPNAEYLATLSGLIRTQSMVCFSS